MDPIGVASAVDLIREEDLADLVPPGSGPCVSILMPAHRAGPETQQGPIRLRNLVADARTQLEGAGAEGEADDLLAPIEALIGDTTFWQHQAGGLALYRCADRFLRFRVGQELPEQAAVASSFALRPLLPSLTSNDTFVLLAVSQAAVRVFECTEATIRPIEVPDLPGSIDEALAHEDPERQLQMRSGGGAAGGAQFHGHGAGEELEKAAVERYLRAIDRPLAKHLAGTRQPLVLAAVGYYGPIYRSVTAHPNVLEEVVEGNPDHRSAEDLHAASLPVVAPVLAQRATTELARLEAAMGTGKAALGAEVAMAAAAEGRVATLFATPGEVIWSDPADDASPSSRVDVIGNAVIHTLRHGGSVHTTSSSELPDRTSAAALLRY